MTRPTLVITMAGASRRFREAGVTVPKYRIEAKGRTLFDWSMTSLAGFCAQGWRFSFVAQRSDCAEPFLAASCPNLGISDWQLVELDGVTDGQATTVLAAAAGADPAAPMAIYNIDTYVEPDALPPQALRGDGWIPCFPGLGEGWSFARTEGPDLRVVEVREKVRISPYCTVGFYGFRSFEIYRSAYETYYAQAGNWEKGERYVAPLYNQLIQDGHPVHAHLIPLEKVHPLGTPDEVLTFTREN